VIDVSGAFQPTGLVQHDGSFDNTGSIVVHDLKAGIVGTAVSFQSVADPHFLNAGLLQGDVALQVTDNEFNGVKLAVNNVYENTGQMVGAINMGFGNETLLNEGQVNGAVDLGSGNDVYDGRLGTETGLVSAGTGNDTLMGGAGFDNLQGNQGDDIIDGGSGGSDWLVGGQNDDSITAHTGQNILYGNLGNDTLHGGNGGDVVRGGQGDDSIAGGSGNDFISGDRGNDTESGGAGADLFHGSQDAGIDRVLDFNPAEGDRVELDPGTTYTVSQVDADTVIDMGPIAGVPNQMILVGVQLSTLKDGWIFEG
jgi:Ca2+-binding RTX toxin-like protein